MAISRVLGVFALAVAIGIGCARYNISQIHRTSMTGQDHIDLSSDKDPMKCTLTCHKTVADTPVIILIHGLSPILQEGPLSLDIFTVSDLHSSCVAGYTATG